MAIENKRSSLLTTIESTTEAGADSRFYSGKVRVREASVSVLGTDDVGSTYRFFRVNSGDSVKSIVVRTDGAAGLTAATFGVYGINGGAVVSGSLWSSLSDMSSAATEELVTLVAESDTTIWEDLALTSDPQLEYDFTMFAGSEPTGDGTVVAVMLYTAHGD